jgi:hypothetical protein
MNNPRAAGPWWSRHDLLKAGAALAAWHSPQDYFGIFDVVRSTPYGSTRRDPAPHSRVTLAGSVIFWRRDRRSKHAVLIPAKTKGRETP